MIFILIVSDCILQVYKECGICKYSRMEKSQKRLKPELSALNKKWKTNGIKWCKVAQGNPDITGAWGRVQSNKQHTYSLGAMRIQLGNLRCTIAWVMGTRDLPVMTL